MKLQSLFAALFLLAILFTGCDNKKEDPAPDPTTENNTNAQTPGMFAKIDGADWGAVIPTASNQNGDFMLGGGAMNGKVIGMYINGQNITQPGTYSGVAMYMEAKQDSTTGPTWVNPAATIIISKLDLPNKKVSGTFSFTAFPSPGTGATGMKTITSGVFNEITLQ